MLIGDLARAAGVSTSAIRFWEREGLLPPPERTAQGFREYDQQAVVRVRIVAGMRRLKASPAEVRAVVYLHHDQGWLQSAPPGDREPLDQAEQRLQRHFDHACLEAARLGELLDALQTAKSHAHVTRVRTDEAERGEGAA